MNILLTSAGRRTYLVQYFKQALAGTGLVHASNSVMTYTLSQADKYVITPNIYDDNYIEFLLTYCKDNQINAIISLFDIDLPVLAKNKDQFEAIGVRLIVSDFAITEICNDKWQSFNFLQRLGLKTPKTFLSLETAKKALQEQEISFPVILKPRWGMGSIGILQADNEEELNVFYKKLKKDIFNTYLRFESNADKDACVLIQEKIQGKEYGLEVLNDLEGNYVTTVAKWKVAMRAGETDVAQIVDGAPFEHIGKLLSKELHHIANLDVDCFLTENDELYILELNCRFGGQYPFSHNAGVDFPKQIVEWLQGNPTQASLVTPQIGVMGGKELLPIVFNHV